MSCGPTPPLKKTGADRALGYLAWKTGQSPQAVGHYSDAIDFCRSGGYRVELAWSLAEYSEMLIEGNVRDDRDKATELQDEALAIAQELGMKPLLERVLAQREILRA